MAVKTYSRFELAENQLTAAIGLFVSGGDRFSVISLAGAADVILSRLVLNSGKENFTDHMLRLEVEKGAEPLTREVFGKGINDALFINQLKHMDDDDNGVIEIEPEECAIAAILKALANYVALSGQQKDIVLAFKAWARQNLDPKKYDVQCDLYWKPESKEA